MSAVEGGEGVPGVGGDWVVAGEGYTGTHHQPSQGPILTIFLASDPTHGQMKVILLFSMRFPEIGSRIDLRMTILTLESTLQTMSPDDLR